MRAEQTDLNRETQTPAMLNLRLHQATTGQPRQGALLRMAPTLYVLTGLECARLGNRRVAQARQMSGASRSARVDAVVGRDGHRAPAPPRRG
eukprot:11691990-Alexandrium_andersonii.AAC.1